MVHIKTEIPNKERPNEGLNPTGFILERKQITLSR